MSDSVLLKIYDMLKSTHLPVEKTPGFVSSQHILYNLLFSPGPHHFYGNTSLDQGRFYAPGFIDCLRLQLKEWHSKDNIPTEFNIESMSEACKWYYLFITDIDLDQYHNYFLYREVSEKYKNNGEQGKIDNAIEQFCKNYYPKISSKDYPTKNQNNPNKNHIIKGERTIDKDWLNAFQPSKNEIENLNSANITYSYVTPLAWILQFYTVFSFKDGIVKNTDPEVNYLDLNYTEYYSLPQSTLEELNLRLADFRKDTVIHSFWDFAKVLYDAILLHIESSFKLTRSKFDTIKKQNMRKNPISLNDEFYFYASRISIYDYTSIDFFNALERYAPSNVYAAQKLGELFFSGASFNIRAKEYKLTRDPLAALKYFFMCCSTDYAYPPACWNISVIIRKYMDFPQKLSINNDDYQTMMFSYLDLCGDYTPALLEKAYVYKKLGDRLFLHDQKPVIPEDTSILGEIIFFYSRFFEYGNRSFMDGWLFAGNAMALFLEENDYQCIIPYLHIIRELQLTSEMIYLTNANSGSPWSMVRLAKLYMDERNKPISPEREASAKDLLETAHSMNYSVATYYLAKYFYASPAQYDMYKALIKSSAEAGFDKAKAELAKLNKSNH